MDTYKTIRATPILKFIPGIGLVNTWQAGAATASLPIIPIGEFLSGIRSNQNGGFIQISGFKLGELSTYVHLKDVILVSTRRVALNHFNADAFGEIAEPHLNASGVTYSELAERMLNYHGPKKITTGEEHLNYPGIPQTLVLSEDKSGTPYQLVLSADGSYYSVQERLLNANGGPKTLVLNADGSYKEIADRMLSHNGSPQNLLINANGSYKEIADRMLSANGSPKTLVIKDSMLKADGEISTYPDIVTYQQIAERFLNADGSTIAGKWVDSGGTTITVGPNSIITYHDESNLPLNTTDGKTFIVPFKAGLTKMILSDDGQILNQYWEPSGVSRGDIGWRRISTDTSTNNTSGNPPISANNSGNPPISANNSPLPATAMGTGTMFAIGTGIVLAIGAAIYFGHKIWKKHHGGTATT